MSYEFLVFNYICVYFNIKKINIYVCIKILKTEKKNTDDMTSVASVVATALLMYGP